MRAGNGLEFLDAVELALVGTIILEILSINDFDGAIRAHDIARQPDFAVAAPANGAQQLVFRNGGQDRVARRRRTSSQAGFCGRRLDMAGGFSSDFGLFLWWEVGHGDVPKPARVSH